MNPASRRRLDASIRKGFTQPIRRTMRREQAAVLKAVAGADTVAQVQRAAAEAVTDARWVAILSTLWMSQPVLHLWDTVHQDLGVEFALTSQTRRTLTRYATSHGRSIAQTHRDRIATTAAEVKTREFRSSMRRALQGLYTEMVDSRAEHLAFVESLQATETIRFEAADQAVARATSLVVRKVWFTMRDTRVRDSHQRMEGQSRLQRTANGGTGIFTVGGSQLRFPRDPQGISREVIGCRCWLEYRKVAPD